MPSHTPASAFAVPASKDGRGKAAALADSLGLGRSRRNVLASGKGAQRRWGGDWDADDIGQLYRRSTSFADFIVLLVSESLSLVSAARPAGKPAMSFASYMGEARKAIMQDAKNDQARASAKEIVTEIAGICNDAKIHPLTLMDVIIGGAVNQAVIEKGKKLDLWRGAASAFKVGDAATRNLLVMLGLTLRRASRRLSRSANPVIALAARLINSLERGLFRGVYSGKGLKPWTKHAGASLGVEIVEFKFIVPTKFDDNGNPDFSTGAVEFRHPTAASKIEESWANSTEELRAGLAETAAGRLYLMFDLKGRGCYLATDRRPNRRLLCVAEDSKRDAAIFGGGPNDLVNGFVV